VCELEWKGSSEESHRRSPRGGRGLGVIGDGLDFYFWAAEEWFKGLGIKYALSIHGTAVIQKITRASCGPVLRCPQRRNAGIFLLGGKKQGGDEQGVRASRSGYSGR